MIWAMTAEGRILGVNDEDFAQKAAEMHLKIDDGVMYFFADLAAPEDV